MAPRSDDMALALDGPGINPDTVDSLALLQLAEAWFRLTLKIAEAEGGGLSFIGLEVVHKCAAVVARVSDVGNATAAVRKAVRVVSGAEPAPQGAIEASHHFGRVLRAVPATQLVKTRVGAKWLPIKKPPLVNEPETPWEMTEMRVTPVRVGGGKEPTAQLLSDAEDAPFILTVSEDNARILGANLYRRVDATLRFCRRHDGRIERGSVIEVSPLEDVEPIAAWRAWFAEDAAVWDGVDDIQAELGRA